MTQNSIRTHQNEDCMGTSQRMHVCAFLTRRMKSNPECHAGFIFIII